MKLLPVPIHRLVENGIGVRSEIVRDAVRDRQTPVVRGFDHRLHR
jgi:hypothetical protein